MYATPTGKAASVIKRRIRKEAYTIHKVLASHKSWRRGSSEKPWQFSRTKILAVDESSMVSLQIFAFLLKLLLSEANLKKVY